MSGAWRSTLESLRRAVLYAPADTAAATVVGWVGEVTGAAATLRLADRAGRHLHPLAGPAGAGSLALDGGAAAEAFWTREVRRERVDGTGLVHVPVTVRGAVLGVLTAAGPASAADHDPCWLGLGEAAALLLVQAGQVTDAGEVQRRTESFSVSAELQWQLLPPTSLVAPGLELHALIEPAPRVSSDLFDWSLDGGRLWLAVLDAEGRNLSASLPAAVALAALRHARRIRLPLAQQVSLADEALYDQFRGHAVVRATVAEIDPAAGTMSAVRAGSGESAPRAFRRREGHVEELGLTDHEDLGRFERSPYRADPVDLAAGDDLLVVTDGGPEARDGGDTFGVPALVEHFTTMAVPAEHPRRLLDLLRAHSGGSMT